MARERRLSALKEYRVASKIRKAGFVFAEWEIPEVAKGYPVKHHDIIHNLKTALWCGPAAIACLTGADTETIRQYIRAFRKDKESKVTGTVDMEIEFAFHKLGYGMRLFYMCCGDRADHLTLSKWLRTYKRKPGVGYVIALCGTKRDPSGHWCVVLGNYYCCNQTGKWVPIDKAPNRRARVDAVYTVQKNRP